MIPIYGNTTLRKRRAHCKLCRVQQELWLHVQRRAEASKSKRTFTLYISFDDQSLTVVDDKEFQHLLSMLAPNPSMCHSLTPFSWLLMRVVRLKEVLLMWGQWGAKLLLCILSITLSVLAPFQELTRKVSS